MRPDSHLCIYNYNYCNSFTTSYCNSSRAIACKPRDYATSYPAWVERFLRLKILVINNKLGFYLNEILAKTKPFKAIGRSQFDVKAFKGGSNRLIQFPCPALFFPYPISVKILIGPAFRYCFHSWSIVNHCKSRLNHARCAIFGHDK